LSCTPDFNVPQVYVLVHRSLAGSRLSFTATWISQPTSSLLFIVAALSTAARRVAPHLLTSTLSHTQSPMEFDRWSFPKLGWQSVVMKKMNLVFRWWLTTC
jgi:hypothetical protein